MGALAVFSKRNGTFLKLHFFWGIVYASESFFVFKRPFGKIIKTPCQGQ